MKNFNQKLLNRFAVGKPLIAICFLLSGVSLLGLFCLSGCVCSNCKSNNTIMQKYVQDSVVHNISKKVAGTVYNDEFGYEFFSSTDGRILKLGVSMPVADTYTVSLWEISSPKVLISEKITVSKANTWCYKKVGPFQIMKGKHYVLSINICGKNGQADKYFNLVNTTFPFIVNGFTVVAGRRGNPSCLPAYPNGSTKDDKVLGGLVDLCFDQYK